jgi:hypothetical protein
MSYCDAIGTIGILTLLLVYATIMYIYFVYCQNRVWTSSFANPTPQAGHFLCREAIRLSRQPLQNAKHQLSPQQSDWPTHCAYT